MGGNSKVKTIDLNGTWRLEGNGYKLEAEVPGSVVSALLAEKSISDPYVGKNEADVQPLFEANYTFSRTFEMSGADMAYPVILLRCDGLDTFCRIKINGETVAATDNMHCQYFFDIHSLVRAGENMITVNFSSPVQRRREAITPIGSMFAGLRKAACMYGWDWGICLPDSGIWRDIAIELRRHARLLDVEVRQDHGQGRVDLQICTHCELYSDGVQTVFRVEDPQGTVVFEQTIPAAAETLQTVSIPAPQLWWPRGYGEQPLYQVSVVLMRDGVCLEAQTHKIGLRTIVLDRGENKISDYRFFVNGLPIYLKGASIVIEDAILSRSASARWRRLIRDAVRSNYNTLRVWGGAYYPPDLFYELCDQAGLLVYQDLMFACRLYWPSREFLDSITQEITHNVIRLRNHPCLCLWCGNNEVDFFYTLFGSDDKEMAALRRYSNVERFSDDFLAAYKQIYEKVFFSVIPEIVTQLSPEVDYIHSSPSAGDDLGADSFYDYFSKGDVHYYHHVDRDSPYQKLGDYHIRFLSEYGFQSYPSLKTLQAYISPDAMSPYSEEMLTHQKRKNGNEIIELYLTRDFFVPRGFAQYVYTSQMMAGEILRHTVEHLRRDRDFNRGVLLWQHNDCWPVVSWSGVDYCGRWKGQQYYTKRLFAPVLVSARLEGDRAELFVVSDLLREKQIDLTWAVYQGQKAVFSDRRRLALPPQSADCHAVIDLTPVSDRREETVVTYSASAEGQILSRDSRLLVEQNRFSFAKPVICLRAEEWADSWRLTLLAEHFIKSVCLDLSEGDALFSDNFFDLFPGEPYAVTIRREDVSGLADLADLRRQLTVECVNGVANGEIRTELIWKENA